MGSQGGRQVGGSSGEDKYKDAPDAKHLLDIIGKDVHDKVKEEAKQYKEALTGQLSFASIFGEETVSTNDPCNIEREYTELINGSGGSVAAGTVARGDPCGNTSASEKRFSKERVDEYDEKKIKDNKSKGGNNEGECAPYRRLSLCNKNFPNMNSNDSSKAKNDLLVDVCYAAKFEGESITRDYPKYETQYPGSGSTMCTMLARSFADIGDIVRGKDLYLGKKKKSKMEKKQKEKN